MTSSVLIPSTRTWLQPRRVALAWREHEIPTGWVPVEIGANPPVIRWKYIGSQVPVEPFFKDTVAMLRLRGQFQCELETHVDTLLHARLPEPAVAPAGIIFHMTRCGSTLVASAVRRATRAIVLSEAAPIDQAIGFVGSASRYWAPLGNELLPRITTLFAHSTGAGPIPIVFKCGAVAIYSFRAIRAIWPHVPCLILIRDPVEVLVSNIQRPSLSLIQQYGNPTPRVAWASPAELATATFAEFCAWAIGRFCSEALSKLDSGCRVLDYGQVTPEAVLRLISYFGLTALDRSVVMECFRQDAKRPNREFRPDSDTKRQFATEDIKAIAEKWIREPYNELLHRSHADWNNLLAGAVL